MKRGYNKYSQEERKEIVKNFMISNLLQKDFAPTVGLEPWRLSEWYNKYRREIVMDLKEEGYDFSLIKHRKSGYSRERNLLTLTDKDWEVVVNNFMASGLKQTEFEQENNIPRRMLSYRYNKLKNHSRKPSYTNEFEEIKQKINKDKDKGKESNILNKICKKLDSVSNNLNEVRDVINDAKQVYLKINEGEEE